MFEFNPIHLAYAVMIIGMIFCFIASKKAGKGIRGGADEFAFQFVKLSNFISPMPPEEKLRVEELGEGRVKALPAKEQPKEIRDIMKRANSYQSVEMYTSLVKAADHLEELVGKNRTNKAQFLVPVNELLVMTHVFLTGCENPDTIDTQEKREQFDSFLQDQVAHRMVLLKRISGEKSEEYQKLNRVYADEMEAREIEEFEAKMKKNQKQPKQR